MRVRSIAATMTFMMAGFVTAMASNTSNYLPVFQNQISLSVGIPIAAVTICVCLLVVGFAFLTQKSLLSTEDAKFYFHLAADFIFGSAFGLAMGVSNMTLLSATISFLDLRYWNVALAFVMCGAIGVAAVSFHFLYKWPSPLLGKEFFCPPSSVIDLKLEFGAAVFGVGWGLMGACPGPGLVNLGSGNIYPLYFVLCLGLGMWIEQLTKDYTDEYMKFEFYSGSKKTFQLVECRTRVSPENQSRERY